MTQITIGTRVRINAPKETSHHDREGNVYDNDGTTLYPFWVRFDDDTNSCFDLEELVDVEAEQEALIEALFEQADTEAAYIENTFALADALAEDSDEYAVTGEGSEDVFYFDNIEDAVNEADLSARDLHNETFTVWKKVYEVRTTFNSTTISQDYK